MKKVQLFSDGSSLGNPGPGGYGGILRYKTTEKRYSGGEDNTTNNRMELKGVIEGLKLLKEPCSVEVISDSSYVINAINRWLANWIKKDFKKVQNVDLWKEYLQVSQPHKVHGKWIKGHVGHKENEICDMMAKDEALKIKKRGKR